MGFCQKIKGTQDFFDDNARKMRFIEDVASKTIKTYGFNEIITPIFENTEVFQKNVGEDSDVVKKEMYTFLDKSNRSITLRPEGTAAVARAFIENKMYATNQQLTKLFYYGPMFRYERPQTGRYREFNQFGVEVYGPSSPMLDSDVIISAFAIFDKLGLKNIKVKINSIGNSESRKNYVNALKKYFEKYIDSMCDDCKRRINTNPMRILDCKIDQNHEAMKSIPSIHDYLTIESKEYFEKVINILDANNINYEIDTKLVRGLDYYTDTVFEFYATNNDNLNIALGGGGRYSDMIKSMINIDIPGIGYAFGIERLMIAMDNENLWGQLITKNVVTIMGLDDISKEKSLILANLLRNNEIIVEMDYINTSMKTQFKLADRTNAKFIIIIGEEERNNNVVTIKNTITKTQETVKDIDVLSYLKERL